MKYVVGLGKSLLVKPFKKEEERLERWFKVQSTVYSSKGPEFNSQQPYGGSQPFEMRSDALFWPAGRHTDRILYT